MSAATTSGAGVGGYEVEVTQLANSAQRTFTFTSPASEETVTIGGKEFEIKAGESAKEFARAINSDSKATVYAAVLEGETVVLSSRATGTAGGELMEVSAPGGALVEVAETAKEGQDAEFNVDGVAGTSSSNTVTDAIAGVTLTLGGLTPTGPVTIDVQAPGPSTSAVEAQVQAFVKLYNSTVEAIQTQLNTRPPAKVAEHERIRHGDPVRRRRTLEPARRHARHHVRTDRGAGRRNVEPVQHRHQHGCAERRRGILAGLARRTAHARPDQARGSHPVELRPAPRRCSSSGRRRSRGWSNNAGGPGGTIEARINGDSAQITELSSQITTMNEMLAAARKSSPGDVRGSWKP